MSNLGSCHKIPQGPNCQIETPEWCLKLSIFSLGVYETHLPLSLKLGFYCYSIFQQQLQVNWTPFLTWQPSRLRICQTELIATGLSHFSSNAVRNRIQAHSEGKFCTPHWRMPLPLIILYPKLCSTPACIGKCACQFCCLHLLLRNGGSNFQLESRILSLLQWLFALIPIYVIDMGMLGRWWRTSKGIYRQSDGQGRVWPIKVVEEYPVLCLVARVNHSTKGSDSPKGTDNSSRQLFTGIWVKHCSPLFSW